MAITLRVRMPPQGVVAGTAAGSLVFIEREGDSYQRSRTLLVPGQQAVAVIALALGPSEETLLLVLANSAMLRLALAPLHSLLVGLCTLDLETSPDGYVFRVYAHWKVGMQQQLDAFCRHTTQETGMQACAEPSTSSVNRLRQTGDALACGFEHAPLYPDCRSRR